MSVTLEDFKKAYDKKGAALDYEKFQGMLDSMAPIPDRQEALAYVKSKSAKKTKSKRKTRKASKSRRR